MAKLIEIKNFHYVDDCRRILTSYIANTVTLARVYTELGNNFDNIDLVISGYSIFEMARKATYSLHSCKETANSDTTQLYQKIVKGCVCQHSPIVGQDLEDSSYILCKLVKLRLHDYVVDYELLLKQVIRQYFALLYIDRNISNNRYVENACYFVSEWLNVYAEDICDLVSLSIGEYFNKLAYDEIVTQYTFTHLDFEDII